MRLRPIAPDVHAVGVIRGTSSTFPSTSNLPCLETSAASTAILRRTPWTSNNKLPPTRS
jgi:hypothetical protein